MLKVVIVGGVAAGMSAASKLKRNLGGGVDITVFEQGDAVSYGACGIPFYLSGHIGEVEDLIARTPEQFAQSGISVHTRCRVDQVDTAAKTVTVTDLDKGSVSRREYDKLIIGSGAKVRRFPPFDKDYTNLYKVRDLQDATALKTALEPESVKKVLLVGGGFIGLEVAEACVKLGKQVTLVELSGHVLPAMDPEITSPLEAVIRQEGISLRTGSRVLELTGGHSVTAAVVQRGEETETLPVDLVINCAGIAPCTDFVEGVAKGNNGAILVNNRMETSLPDIYAAGDCCAMPSYITGQSQYTPLGSNANKQGRIAADVIAGKEPQRLKLLGSSALKLFDLDAAKVGLSQGEAEKMGLPCKANLITGNSYASYYQEGKVTIKLVYHSDTRKIMGAQLVGRGDVVPRANYYAVAITAGMTVDEFGFLDLCYSPPFGGVWDAALIAANSAK